MGSGQQAHILAPDSKFVVTRHSQTLSFEYHFNGIFLAFVNVLDELLLIFFGRSFFSFFVLVPGKPPMILVNGDLLEWKKPECSGFLDILETMPSMSKLIFI